MSKSPTKPAGAKPTKPIAKSPTTKSVAKPTKPQDPSTAPPRTRTLPDHMRGPWTQSPQAITALAVDGEDRIYDMPRTQAVITVGSQNDQDVVIASPYVSRQHCRVERRGLRTYVVDVGSKNGIVFDGVVEKEFEAKPGDRFKLGGALTVVALNDAMRAQLSVIGQLVCREAERAQKGSQDRPSPLDILAIALDAAPVLITGEAGCDHDRLARALHEMSPRRVFDLVTMPAAPADRKGQRAIIDAASRSSLIIPIADGTEPFDQAFVSMLFDRSYNIRLIVLASTVARVADVLGADFVKRMTEVYLRSIAFRPSMILRLLDEILHERSATLHTADMTAANRHALENYDWRRNFDELRQVADWLVLLDKSDSVRAAAQQLGMPPSTFHDRLQEIGVSIPITRHGRALGQR